MSRKPSQSGLAVVFGLILLVIVASVGAWAFLKKDVPASYENVIPPSTEQTSDAAPLENGVSLPQDEATATTDATTEAVETPATETANGPVTVDIEQVMGTRAIGNPNAPIHVIEYASLTCSHCAHFHNDILPKMKEKYIDTGKVYFEFREFPLNDPALKGTITARCLPPERYDGFVSLLFKNQEKWAGGIDYMAYLKQNAKLAGLSDEQFQACHDNGEIKSRLAAVMQDAQDRWKISSTPTFVINNGAQTVSGAQPLENFERIFRAVSSGVVGDAPKVE